MRRNPFYQGQIYSDRDTGARCRGACTTGCTGSNCCGACTIGCTGSNCGITYNTHAGSGERTLCAGGYSVRGWYGRNTAAA